MHRRVIASFAVALGLLTIVGAPARAADPMRSDCTATGVARDSLAHPESRRGEMDEQVCFGLDRGADGRRIELFGGTIDEGARQRGIADPGIDRQREGIPGSTSDGYLGLRLRVPY